MTAEQFIQKHGATLKEALQGIAAHRHSIAVGYLYDVERCEGSDNEAIRGRAVELRARAEVFKAEAARFRDALEAISPLDSTPPSSETKS